ncbi:MAG: hypothetical protein ACFCVD_00085 [Nodosilinea sp.]
MPSYKKNLVLGVPLLFLLVGAIGYATWFLFKERPTSVSLKPEESSPQPDSYSRGQENFPAIFENPKESFLSNFLSFREQEDFPLIAELSNPKLQQEIQALLLANDRLRDQLYDKSRNRQASDGETLNRLRDEVSYEQNKNEAFEDEMDNMRDRLVKVDYQAIVLSQCMVDVSQFTSKLADTTDSITEGNFREILLQGSTFAQPLNSLLDSWQNGACEEAKSVAESYKNEGNLPMYINETLRQEF